jgi:hypothetical protein
MTTTIDININIRYRKQFEIICFSKIGKYNNCAVDSGLAVLLTEDGFECGSITASGAFHPATIYKNYSGAAKWFGTYMTKTGREAFQFEFFKRGC